MKATIYLASRSPRRIELLKQLGLKFLVEPSLVEPDLPEGKCPDPALAVREISHIKASDVARRTGSGIVIAADTAVYLHGAIMGKPASFKDAYRMLCGLNGNMHEVYTGITVMDAAKNIALTGHEVTRVFFRDLPEGRIRSYLETGEPMDKAGAYGIQGLGSLLVARIEGCYFNVVGLPIAVLDALLQQVGVLLLGAD
ncbi:MAG: Maf family protein [Bacillota bacterium]